MAGDREALVAEVNRIYWETEMPVTEMAEKLGISRRTIYDMLKPFPAGERCTECGGGELVYPNRSARLAEEAVCSACGRTQDVTLLRELSARATPPARVPGEAVTTTRGAEVTRRDREVELEVRGPTPRRPSPALAAVLMAGLIIAVAAALLTPRRRNRGWWR